MLIPSADLPPPLRYVVVFDPLDGSRNIDASIPTGTIFGVYERPAGASAEAAALQPGTKLVASG
jgi:fructose-1,6-bisphosphatase I